MKEHEIAYRNKKVNEKVKQYGKLLYHYTSTASLFNILKNKELWLGNTASMNDKTEVVHFLNQLHEALLDTLDPIQHFECNDFFNKIYKKVEKQYPYAFCLSKLSDNAAQWERYGDNAEGICIAFNTSSFLNLFYYSETLFNEVYYDEEITLNMHFSNLYNYFNFGHAKYEDIENDYISNLIAYGYIHKHNSFSSECEIRLITLWNNNIIKHSHIAFELLGNRVKKVLKVPLDKLCNSEKVDFESLIDQITIGPRSSQNLHELQEYIKSLGFTTLANKVIISKCPLR